MSSSTYEEKCAYFTTAQGLDPVVSAITESSRMVVVEQTGGFNMVATVPYVDGVWAVTYEEGEGYFANWFPGLSWQEGPVEDATEILATTLEELVRVVSAPYRA